MGILFHFTAKEAKYWEVFINLHMVNELVQACRLGGILIDQTTKMGSKGFILEARKHFSHIGRKEKIGEEHKRAEIERRVCEKSFF